MSKKLPLRMTVISEPKEGTRSVLVMGPDVTGSLIKGGGDLSYMCGECGKTLLRNVGYKQIQNVVIKCNNCERHNEIPAAHHSN